MGADFYAMEPRTVCIRFFILVVYLFNISATLTDARSVAGFLNFQGSKYEAMKKISSPKPYPSNAGPYGLNSPFSVPSFESLPPLSSPENSPPFPYPPFTTEITPMPPPPPPYANNFPFQSPPIAHPPAILPGANPPEDAIRPPSSIPSPPVHEPPVIYQPPSSRAPPPPHKGPQLSVWCVAKPTVPGPLIQEAMDYACGSGADCKSIQPNGPCFQPNTLLAHASYAFNSYWQSTKVTGGTCDFGGTAMLITHDPSFDKCQFIYN